MKFEVGDIVRYTGKNNNTLTRWRHYKVTWADEYQVRILNNKGFHVFIFNEYLELVTRQMTLSIFDEKEMLSQDNVNKCECGSHKIGNTEPGLAHSDWCPIYRKC